jgi:photosystem II stability/assembly factor-like uncharacterized protein
MPSAHVVVDAADGRVLRSTDDARTWRVVVGRVSRAGGSDAVRDLGFTTTTQGFVVYDHAGMLMTRDAGKTWARVNLP